ncbi:MAG: hypothetical protein FWB74_10840 [Defluviitaleaceae bacterium]|nr:hypothetical protein [Defluviitaleaceae bacterium]
MYRKIEPPERMTAYEAWRKYSTEYVMFHFDEQQRLVADGAGMGTVLFAGSSEFELRGSSRDNFGVNWGSLSDDYVIIEGPDIIKEYILDGVYASEGNSD